MNNKIIVGVMGAIVLAGASFYGGMTYAKSGAPERSQFSAGQFMGMGGSQFQGGGMRGSMNGGITLGEIIAKDASSITVKMQEGSTKIILMSTSTQVVKTTEGLAADLVVGTTVMVTGSPNSDGSITGQSVQIRPVGAAR